MTTKRIAVIGSGAAGIGAAYTARSRANVVVFESESIPGGHAHSVDLGDGIGADTGFIVFNRANYPQLSELFNELEIQTNKHRGRFCFFNEKTGRVYGSDELESDETPQDPVLATIFEESDRFAKEGMKDFIRGKADIPLGEYLDKRGYSDVFKSEYITLLSTAVWSAPADLIWEMPASTVIAYFSSHGGSGLGGRGVNWETIRGGSSVYVNKALKASGAELRLNSTVSSVEVTQDGVCITVENAEPELFDGVVIATHGDTARDILRTPTEGQSQILDSMRYNRSYLVLHTDTSVLPEEKPRWGSWNYGSTTVDGQERSYVAWYLNLLQDFEADTDYIVTVDYPADIPAEKVIEEFYYEHPIIDLNLRRLQRRVYELANTDTVTLAGSYMHSTKLGWDVIGSHEVSYSSGVAAINHLLHD